MREQDRRQNGIEVEDATVQAPSLMKAGLADRLGFTDVE